jgi:hypothetical protein
MSEPTTEKPSAFRRLRAKFREIDTAKQRMDWHIRDLEVQVRAEQAKAREADERLRRTVNGTAVRDNISQTITLCVKVDLRTARDFPLVWEEARNQLAAAIAKEMRR